MPDTPEALAQPLRGAPAESTPAIRRNLWISLATGGATALMSLLVLAGWQWNLSFLKSFSADWVAMGVNTALAMLACGAALMLLSGKAFPVARSRLATLLASAVIVVAALKLAQYLFDLDLDQPWFHGGWQFLLASQPARSVPTTAFCFVLAGCALLAAAWPNPGRIRLPTINITSMALMLIGGFALCGNAAEMASGHRNTLMAVSTAIGFILLGGGLLALMRAGDGLIWSLSRWTNGGLVTGIVLLLVAGGISNTLIVQLQFRASQVDHRQQVLRKIQEIASGLENLESDQRGHFITGDERMLAGRDVMKDAARESLRQAQELTADNPRQQERLGRLESLVTQCIEWEERLIAMRREKGRPAAPEMAISETGAGLLEAIRGLLKDSRDEEYALLLVDQKKSDRATAAAFLLLPLGVFFSLTMLLLGTTFLNSGKGRQNRAELALGASELRYQRLFESAREGILILDAETGMVIDVNAFLIATLGYSHEQFLGKAIWELGFFKDIVANEDKLRELREKESIRYDNLPLETIDGRQIDVEFVSNLHEVNGEKVIQCNVRDITARRQAEEAVRHERALLRALIDSIPDLVFFKDEQFVFLGCNKAFERHLGITEEKLVGLTDYDIVPNDMAENFRRMDREIIVSGSIRRVDDWIPSLGGGGRNFETVKTPFYGPGGESLGLVGISRDITERKQAEMEVLFNAQRYRSLVEATSAIVWDSPDSGEFDAEQPGWTAFTGQSFAELRGLGWLEAVHPDDRAKTIQAWTKASAHQSLFEVEHRLRAQDQTYRDMMVRAVPILAEDGTTRQWIGVHTDVTEERRHEKELAEALAQEKELSVKAQAGERAKSDFLAVMSHEIRTPLNGILGFSQLLALTPNLPPESGDYVQTIASSGEALLRILNDVLDFSRLEAGQVRIELNRFAPQEILGDIRVLLEQQARDKGLALEVFLATNVAKHLTGDVGRLRQIVLNLVGNALKFTEHGTVTLGLRPGRKTAHYEFFVKDSGCGITPRQEERLFQPFTQADSSISRRYGGTGLGLSISRRLAELMGGTLTVISQPGEGSEFILSIPLGEAEPPPGKPSDAAPLALDATFAIQHPLRILVVEDDKVNLKLILSLIRRLGYTPSAARNGREAVEMHDQERPDCVLMDMQMPEMDGIEATEKIRAREKITLPHRPVFISALSANIFPADRQRCLDAGMNRYLDKPVKLTALALMLVEAGEFIALRA